MHNGEETVRFAPRNNPCRKKNGSAPVRRSSRNVAGKAYSDTHPPIPVVPYPSVHDQVHHPVPFLDGQDDIPRSDDEGGSVIPLQRVAPESRQVACPEMPIPASSPGPVGLASITPELPDPGNLPGLGDSGTSPSPSHPLPSPPNPLGPALPESLAPAPGNATQAPNSSSRAFIPVRNPNLGPLEDLEQRQNERRARLALMANVLLYGPSKRHVNNYASNLYARTKPQIYRPNLKALNGPDNSKKYQGSFSVAEQLLMYPAEHSMLYDLICIDPFPIDDATVTRGFTFAQSVISTKLDGNGPSLALKLFMMSKLSRKRNSLLTLVQNGILDKYGLPPHAAFDDLDAYHRITGLMNNDSFVNAPSNEAKSTAKFTHAAIVDVLKVLFFKTKPSVGILFMDRVASGDSEALWHSTRSDKSLEALRGMPVGAIAFACILIKHTLFNYKQTILNEPRASFEGKTYSIEWDRYHRSLAALVDLGQLRGQLFDMIKPLYFQMCPYNLDESMVQDDTLW